MKRLLFITLLLCCTTLPAFAGLKEGDEAMEKEDFKTALKEFTALANKGDAQAQFNLGAMYNEGLGVDEDVAKAFAFFLKAAEQKHPRAQFVVGHMYSSGRGVTANKQESLQWKQKAASQGYAQAQSDLGDHDYEQKNYAEALVWYRKAAEQNNANAQYGIGYQYYKGEGVPVDLNEAIQWMLKAANQGNVNAQDDLANIYARQKNYADAVKWTLKLAEGGSINRIRILGVFYENGIGVQKDLITAYQFYSVAATMGHDAKATELKTELEKKLSAHDQKMGAQGAMRWMMVGPGQLRALH